MEVKMFRKTSGEERLFSRNFVISGTTIAKAVFILDTPNFGFIDIVSSWDSTTSVSQLVSYWQDKAMIRLECDKNLGDLETMVGQWTQFPDPEIKQWWVGEPKT